MTEQSADGGLRPIGNLAIRIVNSPDRPDSQTTTSTTSPAISSITGSLQAVETQSNSTGRRRGEIASAKSVSVAATDPHQRDKSAEEWLRSRLSWQPNMRLVRFPDDGHGWDGCAVPRPPAEWTTQAREEWDDARRQILRICEPCGESVVLAELAKLRVTMAHRNGSDIDQRALFAVMAEDLAEFPADVVRAACTGWRRREKWFPTPAELIDECQRLSRRRYAMRAALAKGAA